MRRLLDLVERFHRDERGAFAATFGLMAIVLVALSGAVVDYVALQQTRARAQVALDAAALALQPQIYNANVSDDDIKLKAQNLMRERIGDEWSAESEVELIVTDTENGSLYLRARMSMPTMFVTLVGVHDLSARIESEATRKKLALEVAFVLDNSGSMSYTGAGPNGNRQRIQFLKDAANCATNILFYKDVVDDPGNTDTCIPVNGATQIEDVSIGVIPFNMMVNVGASNSNASWIDQAGNSVTANDNFDNDDDEDTASPATRNRFDLFSVTGETWRGCVEARPHIKTGSTANEYLDTDDTLPAGGNTRFVPMFSPDMIDGVGNNNYVSDSPSICDRPSGVCTQAQYRVNCNSGMSNGSCTTQTAQTPTPTSGPTNFSSNDKFAGGYYGAHSPTCDCRSWSSYGSWNYQSGNGNNQTFMRTRTCSSAGYVPTGLAARELQERICKYHSSTSGISFSKGPNADCVRTAILPLSTTPATVTTTIAGMIAEGGTNIHQGTVWGFRVLSPTLPFDQGGPYDEATSKVIIVMTDGENTAYNLSTHCGSTQRNLNGSCYNSAYGFPYNSLNTNGNSSSGGNIERLGPSSSIGGSLGSSNATLVSEMNNRTRQSCENAKAEGITIYTIGLATADAVQSTQAEVEDMLADCASTRNKAYFPTTPGELKAVFQAIANDLSSLRLAL